MQKLTDDQEWWAIAITPCDIYPTFPVAQDLTKTFPSSSIFKTWSGSPSKTVKYDSLSALKYSPALILSMLVHNDKKKQAKYDVQVWTKNKESFNSKYYKSYADQLICTEKEVSKTYFKYI